MLTEEIDHAGRFYGTPTKMFVAVKDIRSDIRTAQKVLGENHPDIELLAEMAKSCNEFATILEPYTVNEEFSSGGDAFLWEIEDAHFDFQDKVTDLKIELAKRHGINPWIM